MKFIGVDVDGVLGDQVPHTLDWLRKRGVKHEKSKENITSWTEPVTDRISFDQAIEKALLDKQFVREMPIIKDSKETLKVLHKNHRIIIASSRPRETQEITEEWLRTHFKYHMYINTRGRDKDEFGLDILIDDNIDNVRHVAESGGIAILFDQPWNRDVDEEIELFLRKRKIIRCTCWSEVLEAINRITGKGNS